MKIGVVKGNGIGPEITEATKLVMAATGIPMQWRDIPVAEEAEKLFGHPLPKESIEMMEEVKLVLKAPLIVNKLQGRITCVQEDGSEETYPSLNNAIRRELKLYVNPRPIKGFPRLSGAYEKLDMVVMREVTEDVYIGWEHRIGNTAAEAIKLVTREAAIRVAKFAFDYARENNRRKVTCLHKANVLNMTDGLFLTCCREVAIDYPDIEFDDYMIDAACYTIVKNPEVFDVVVTLNQYGDIFSDLGAGLIGSLGLAPGANIGELASVFEAAHGAAPDIAGQGVANPIALILSGALLFKHAGYLNEGSAIETAVRQVLIEGSRLTPDLGGEASTMELAEEIANKLIKQ